MKILLKKYQIHHEEKLFNISRSLSMSGKELLAPSPRNSSVATIVPSLKQSLLYELFILYFIEKKYKINIEFNIINHRSNLHIIIDILNIFI